MSVLKPVSVVAGALALAGTLLLSGCATSPTPTTASSPTASEGSREAAWLAKNVRTCVIQKGTSYAELSPFKWTTGPIISLEKLNDGGCYENDNDKQRTGMMFQFRDNTVYMLVKNYVTGAPDVFLCGKIDTALWSSPDCAEPIYGKNDFSAEWETHTMTALGHTFKVIRTKDVTDFKTFQVELIK